ncbi:MAG: trypsin-like peptidase domain-containing protein [Acidobacteriota bacterium]|nr:trypsin-like peptidase domain-containing protein [Acidobacteriota bacterium]
MTHRHRLIIPLVFVLAGFVAGVIVTGRLPLANSGLAGSHQAAPADAASNVIPPPAAPPVAATAGRGPGGLPDFTTVAAEAVRGVANISSLQVVRTPNSPFASDPFFSYFFGNDDEMFGSHDQRQLSLGSGVIVSSDGYVVTNNHVVGRHVREINVILPDKRQVRGRIVGTDPMTDVALLKIDAKGLPVIPWGDSSQLKVGQWVLAIGSPFQLSQTVTLGIVSAVGRANIGLADYEDFIQTDAAINPGNSGGALINAAGQVIGINTGILSESGGYQGIGFAIPSNLVRKVVDDLIKYGEVRRGSIGYVQTTAITQALAGQLGLTQTQGALVTRMARDSSAFRAGIRPGDVIVSFNGEPVNEPSDLLRHVSDARAGTTARVGLIRDGRRQELTVSIVQGGQISPRDGQ